MKMKLPVGLLKQVGIVVLGIIVANEIIPWYAKARSYIASKTTGKGA